METEKNFFGHDFEPTKESVNELINKITNIMNEKRAIYNLNVDQRTKKFGKGEKLLKYDFQKLPDYIKNNKSKYERWLD